MGTLVAVECDEGVVLASDTLAVDAGGVKSKRARRLFEFDNALAGAIGEQGDVQAFGRRIEAELQQVDVEAGVDLGVTRLGRIAADVAADVGVDAFVATRDDDGEANVVQVGPDASTTSVEVGALGSGSQVALGHLEGADIPVELDDTVELARESVRVAQDRDPETGGAVEVVTLADRE